MFAALIRSNGADYFVIYHTILELACIFIALSVFFSVWFTSSHSTSDNFILGFGYLSVAIFDSFHAFYFLKQNISTVNYLDITAKFWILGRITETYILFFFTQFLYVKVRRWPVLSFSMAVPIAISYFVINFNDFIPPLQTENGVTSIKVALELIVIFIYLTTLFNLNSENIGHHRVTYKYILLSIIAAISYEICFTAYTSIHSLIGVMGHTLKLISYFFLFRGTFVSTVIYPYYMLEEENKKLNKAYEKLDSAHKEKENAINTLNEILDALPVGVLTYDSNDRLMFANKKFEEMLECKKNDIYYNTSEDVVKKFHSSDDKKYTSFKNESAIHNEVGTYCTSNGKNIMLSSTSHDLCNGKLMLFYDAKKEQELENIHLQTQTILNTVSNCILMIDRNKKVVLCNKALENVFEMKRNDILGMDIDELNELLSFGAKELPDLVLTGNYNKQFCEVSLTSAKGNKKTLQLCLSAINNVYGEIIGGISVGTDITESRKEQDKIVQQEKLALLGQMGAGIVHETRNYLTTIKGRCQLIDLLSSNENIRKHTQKINNNIDEVNRIISEFLYLSKPREFKLIEVSMFDIINSIKSMVETSSLVEGVNVIFHISKEKKFLLCDEAQIKQVILNICKNAVDAMSDKKDAILIIRTGYNEQYNEMFIKISDNGNGISPEDLVKLGTPFFTTKKNGTGLGLSVCHQIIKGHNGELKIDSKFGEGTAFTILLPCLKDAAEEPA